MTKLQPGAIVVIAVLVVLLGFATFFAVKGLEVPGVAVPEAGWVALAFGALFSVLVGVGLMALLFYSSRKGFDEPPHLEKDPDDNSRL